MTRNERVKFLKKEYNLGLMDIKQAFDFYGGIEPSDKEILVYLNYISSQIAVKTEHDMRLYNCISSLGTDNKELLYKFCESPREKSLMKLLVERSNHL